MGRALGPLVHVMGEDRVLDRTHTARPSTPSCPQLSVREEATISVHTARPRV
jgi:hypothetical protein